MFAVSTALPNHHQRVYGLASGCVSIQFCAEAPMPANSKDNMTIDILFIVMQIKFSIFNSQFNSRLVFVPL